MAKEKKQTRRDRMTDLLVERDWRRGWSMNDLRLQWDLDCWTKNGQVIFIQTFTHADGDSIHIYHGSALHKWDKIAKWLDEIVADPSEKMQPEEMIGHILKKVKKLCPDDGLRDVRGEDISDDPVIRMLVVIAHWQMNELATPEEALREYGLRFLQRLEAAGLKVVLK